MTGKHLHDPLCELKVGKAPKEVVDIDTFNNNAQKIDTSIEDLDADFYGDESFNDDELENLDELDDSSLQ